MKRPSLCLFSLAVLASLPARSAMLVNTRTVGTSGQVRAVPVLRINGLGTGLSAAPGLTLSVAGPSLPSVAAPSILPLAAPGEGLSVPSLPSAAQEDPQSLSGKVTAISEQAQPDLKALSDISLQGEGSQAAGERVMAAVLGTRVRSLPDLALSPAESGTPVMPGQGLQAPAKNARKTTRLVKQVSYSEAVPDESKALMEETLSRRKASWIRQLGAMGVELAGPVEPVLSVKASRDILKGEKVEFTVEWNQGETKVGSFKAVVTRKNLNPDLRRLPAPPVADEKKVVLRFKKSVVKDAAGLKIEAAVTDADIKAFLEEHRLRLVTEDRYNGIVIAAVTGKDEAPSLSDELTGRGLLLSAAPFKLDAPAERQIRLVFKKTTVKDFGVRVEVGVSDTDKAELLRSKGLRVLEITRDGEFRVAVAPGVSADAAAADLAGTGIVRHAYAALADAPEDRQVVLKFRDTAAIDAGGLKVETKIGDDQVAEVLTSRGIRVLESLGEGFYRVAAAEGMTGKELASALAAEAGVASAVAVGGLSDAEVEASARGAASYKGRPWSSTEYNMNYSMTEWNLVERGATKAQLEKFRKLCDEAPVRGGGFNPWSGD
ncbi:MAG: hypothetical protein HY924_13290 [Elusimicrobia bacterium]|nr:hypothetical protein [Elusimicrobiota bacterium]